MLGRCARYDPNWISGHFRRLRKRFGWPKATHFHDLRHTSATLAIAKGEPLKVTQERLGHASPATTLAVYGHATPEMPPRSSPSYRSGVYPLNVSLSPPSFSSASPRSADHFLHNEL